jgi:CBS domain containing-hemolysin-like protein
VLVAPPVFALDADTAMYTVLQAMRETRNHPAVVTDAEAVVG